jgi:Cu-processing system permease protein
MNVIALVFAAGVRDLLRNRWLAAYGIGFFIAGEGLFWFGGTGPQVALSLLNIVLLVVPLVALAFGVIHTHASREFVELLLSQPVARDRLFIGQYLGLATPFAIAFLVGVVLTLLGAGVALTFICTGIAMWIALRTDDRLRAMGAALGTWLAVTVLYDGAVLAFASAFDAWPVERPVLALMFINPIDTARVLVMTHLDVSALMGYTGALFERAFGSALGTTVAVLALLAWCIVPFLLARRRFCRRDF